MEEKTIHRISGLPIRSLVFLPTPLSELKALSQFLGGPRLFMKRDDLTGLALGGNKTRKLEYLLGEATANGCDSVITCGAPESNHCRQTSAAAASLGLKCHLALAGSALHQSKGNLFLDRLFGAQIHWCGDHSFEEQLGIIETELLGKGFRPSIIPFGGSNATGVLGFMAAIMELKHQMTEMKLNISHILVPSSSGGTQAGIVAGVALSGLPIKVIGIGIDRQSSGNPAYEDDLAELANGALAKIGVESGLSPRDFQMNYDYFGDGYGVLGPLEREAITLTATKEGILLDPVYNSRTMGALIDMIRQHRFKTSDNVLIWNTGGIPALFDRMDELSVI